MHPNVYPVNYHVEQEVLLLHLLHPSPLAQVDENYDPTDFLQGLASGELVVPKAPQPGDDHLQVLGLVLLSWLPVLLSPAPAWRKYLLCISNTFLTNLGYLKEHTHLFSSLLSCAYLLLVPPALAFCTLPPALTSCLLLVSRMTWQSATTARKRRRKVIPWRFRGIFPEPCHFV